MPAASELFVVDRATLTPRELTLLHHLEREYTPSLAADVLKPLLTQESPVSLRALDWTVTNWSKQHNVVCASTVPGQLTNVHHAYLVTLGYWKRRLFDPFRRRARIGIRIGDEVFDTTLGQANFALFSYKTGILHYVLGHIEAIEADMNAVAQTQKRRRKAAQQRGVRRKRTELTASPGAMCVAYAAPCRVAF
jgi:hypothetical protein